MINYPAKYTKIKKGYMGQLVEWPEVLTEGKDLEECREMLRDALNEMILAYRQLKNDTKIVPVKRHKQFDRITANEICNQAGLEPKY
jgi:predicted RNase H-like HicB family nuclease